MRCRWRAAFQPPRARGWQKIPNRSFVRLMTRRVNRVSSLEKVTQCAAGLHDVKRQAPPGGQAMNAETDQWESYIDRAGRQHWRWPAANEQLAARLADDEQRHGPK